MDLLTSFLGRSGLLPHGVCFTWSPALLWPMVGADTLIALAYFSIPMSIVRFVRGREEEMAFRGLAWLFSGFIFACGLTHVMDIWTIWQPDYGPQALTKVVTAVISVATAIALWRLVPKALTIPSVARLQQAVQELEREVARRRSAEEHLAEVQQSLAVTLSSIGAGFLATDRAGRVTRMNSVAEQVLGWTEAEAQGRGAWEVFDREGRPADFAQRNPVDVMIEQGWTVDTARNLVAVSRSGARTSVEVKAALTHADDGSVRGMVVVFRDLTQAELAEAASARLAAIVESSNDAIIGKTLDGRITSWNRAAELMFGYPAAEAIGRQVQMLIPPEREAEEMRILADLSGGHTVPAFETQRRRSDGRLLDVSLSISPIRNARGQTIGASKIVRDITEQRRAAAALQESEARLRFTLEAAQIGDWELELATGVMRRSLLHARCFGYDDVPEDWTFDVFVRHLHPDDRPEVLRLFRLAVSEREDWTFDSRVFWPDDSEHWIRVHATVRLSGDRATHATGIIFDITQQKRAEQARLTAQRLEAENRQIQEASRLKSQFLANMSHELRTPLNAIIGFADLLFKGVVRPESPKHHEYLGHIGTSGRHLLQLINDVLDLSKVESGKFEFFPEPVHLPRLVQEVVDVLHPALQRKQLVLRTDIDPGVAGQGALVLDPARLKQALYNFLSNAIKFTPDGGEVTVRARPEDGLPPGTRWRLEVEDTGIGIAAEDLPLLFTEFQQLETGYNKRHQGTGLGLALTRRLVQAQGGTVGVRSAPGVGSVFHLVMPCVAGAEPVAPTAPEPRMLVIEDDLLPQARLVRALADAGFQVDAAASSVDALRQAMAQAYGAITLDLVLPGQHGLELLARIRSEGPSRASPVVGVSMPADTGSAATFAVTDVLFKPIRTDEVVAALARVRPQSARSTTVMVVDDDPLARSLMQATLAGMGIHAVCIDGGRAALRALDEHRPDALILDLMMPEFDGFAVLDALGDLPAWRALPVFIWTSMLLTDAELASLGRSARAILGKGGGDVAGLLQRLRPLAPPGVPLLEGG